MIWLAGLHANIPGSTLKMFPDCGMPNYQAPEPFAKEVTSFLLDWSGVLRGAVDEPVGALDAVQDGL